MQMLRKSTANIHSGHGFPDILVTDEPAVVHAERILWAAVLVPLQDRRDLPEGI